MKKTIIISLIILVGLGAALFFQMSGLMASRIILENGDLYSVRETLGAKKFTDLGDIKFIFDKTNDKILYGRGWQGALPETELTGGTELWLKNMGSKNDKKLVDNRITWAVFQDNNNVLYNDEFMDIYQINLINKEKKKIADKAIFFDHPWQGKLLVAQKINDDWQPGNYFDQSKGIAIINIKTGEIKMATNDLEDFGPIWTPNGKKIAFFSRSPEGLASLFMVNTDGSNRKQMTNIGEMFVSGKTIPIPSEKPIWSNNSRDLVYESDQTIWYLKFNESQTEIIKAKKIAYGIDPQWEIDGKSISVVIANLKENKKTIQTINLEE